MFGVVGVRFWDRLTCDGCGEEETAGGYGEWEELGRHLEFKRGLCDALVFVSLLVVASGVNY